MEFRQCLAETLAWCRPRFDAASPADCLRSAELAPARNIVHEVRRLQEVSYEIGEVIGRRRALLGSVPPIFSLPEGDRILAFLPQHSLWHGSSVPVTDGFIDEDEIPPWDSWILLVDEVLLSWVPASMVPAVDEAILLNPEESIRWASSLTDSATREMQAEGLIV
ncbi:MAG: hypothetical protein KY476_25830 [Planctomycetes bacterium]|nr:hypothetical protein [Planctomycetota bacterium]